jgi:hypothetical protein
MRRASECARFRCSSLERTASEVLEASPFPPGRSTRWRFWTSALVPCPDPGVAVSFGLVVDCQRPHKRAQAVCLIGFHVTRKHQLREEVIA